MTHPFKRTALILATGGAICAYAVAAEAQLRPNFPIRLEDARPSTPTPGPQADTPTITAPQVKREVSPPTQMVAVESRALAPLAAPRQTEREDGEAPTRARTETRRAVTGRVVDAAGKPRTYTVKKGDTLEEIAGRLDMTLAELKKLNALKSSRIQPGQKLKGEAASQKAYVVGDGDTLAAVSRRFGVSTEALREENDLSRSAAIRAGQRLRLPAGFRDKGPITTTTRVAQSEEPAPARGARSRTRTAEAPVQEEADVTSERGGSRRTITGRLVDVDGAARTYTVKRGDNLTEIAERLDTTVAELRKDNRLKGSTVRPGQVLKGPPTKARAYVANSGDTLSGIARRFGVTSEAIRSANGLSRNAAIRDGQRIRLPSGYRDRGAIVVAAAEPPRRVETPAPAAEPTPRVTSRREDPPPSLPSAPQPYFPSGARYTPPAQATPRPYTPPVQSTPRPYTPPPSRTAPPAAPVAAPALSDSQISELGAGRFVWPLRGDVISDFGPKTAGQRNDGINIRSDAGQPVRAAAAGEVVYAGDQVPGFGNLVLVKHPDGWVTAYGHLQRTEVKMQQRITQGQQIGLVGSSGGVGEPQLHFEVRYAPSALDRARPVDPTLVLPR